MPTHSSTESALALRWTLSQPITAAVPPGDEWYFRRALEVAARFDPIAKDEEKKLMAGAAGVDSLFHLAHA